jgi:hypothetical protein
MKHNLLISDELSNNIHSLIHEMKLHLYGVDYFSFGFNDYINNLAYSFSSRPEWFNFLKKDDEAGSIILNYDYVWKNSFVFHDTCVLNHIPYNERTFLISSFDYSSKMHKEILRYKNKFDINRGVCYLEHSSYRTFSSNFFTNYKLFNELNFAIKNRNLILKMHKLSKNIVAKHFNINFEPMSPELQTQSERLLYLDRRYRR